MKDNGYIPSIVQSDTSYCFLCGRTNDKLDRHEIYGGSRRSKSKSYGLWVALCHSTCHEGRDGVHQNAEAGFWLKQYGQRCAMSHYDMTEEDFISLFGRSYL